MIKLINLENHSDDRGSLVAIEYPRNIPFEIKRVYYLFNNKENIDRGKHAHKKLKQVYVVVSGSCIVEFDNGKEKSKIELNNPKQGILIEEIIWREIKNMSKDCVLLVLADEIYKETDYIRDYQEFIDFIK